MSVPVNTQASGQSLKRLERAAAARILLSLHEKGQLANPEQWNWGVLDALPAWCLLDEQARVQLQSVCGALVLAPELRLWIDRELISAGHSVIGLHHFNSIVARADQAKLAIDAAAGERFQSVSGKAALRDAVQSAFLQAGASVLKASLTNEVLIERFSQIPGDTAGELRHQLAEKILQQAQEMISQSDLPVKPESNAVNHVIQHKKEIGDRDVAGQVTSDIADNAPNNVSSNVLSNDSSNDSSNVSSNDSSKVSNNLVKADVRRRSVKADEVRA